MGTCVTSQKCLSISGGFAAQNCASGFGVCCVITLSSCQNVIVDQNCTYVTNPGFPGTFSEAATCKYTIRQCSEDICFIRLDFDSFSTEGPDMVRLFLHEIFISFWVSSVISHLSERLWYRRERLHSGQVQLLCSQRRRRPDHLWREHRAPHVPQRRPKEQR